MLTAATEREKTRLRLFRFSNYRDRGIYYVRMKRNFNNTGVKYFYSFNVYTCNMSFIFLRDTIYRWNKWNRNGGRINLFIGVNGLSANNDASKIFGSLHIRLGICHVYGSVEIWRFVENSFHLKIFVKNLYSTKKLRVQTDWVYIDFVCLHYSNGNITSL